MKHRLFKWIFGVGILYMSHSVVYAENMNLIYDGKNHLYTEKPINLYIDGQEVETTVMPPIQLNYTTLVPVREVFAKLGAEVEWRPSEQSVYVYNNETLIVLKINSEEAFVDGETKKLNMPAKLINDKVMIPIRFISESLGYTVDWSKEDLSVYISTNREADDDTIDNDIMEDDITDNDVIDDDITSDDLTNNSEMNESEMGEGENNGVEDNIDTSINSTFNTPYISLTQEHTIMLTNIYGLQANQITYYEDEYAKQISIQLNGDYSAYIPQGSFPIVDDCIEQIDITHQMGTTQMVIATSKISALQVSEENGFIQLKVVKPSEKYEKIVVIDAGHGAHDSGTSYGNLKEKDLNLQLSNELVSLLQFDPNIKVYATRVDDTFVELMDRVEFSNEIDPDLFISIHINSATNTSASGTETYYTYDMTDSKNKIFATMVQDALVNEFGTKDRGVKSNTFVVTRYTDAPAILIEIGFISNESDRIMMTSSDFVTRYAQTVYECILNYYAQGLNN